jgi:hypothetical protein
MVILRHEVASFVVIETLRAQGDIAVTIGASPDTSLLQRVSKRSIPSRPTVKQAADLGAVLCAIKPVKIKSL